MFQKLYKHLEEMNTHLRQQEIHIDEAKEQTGQVSGQLETINNALLSQNELLASQNLLSKEVLVDRKRGLAPLLQAVNLTLCCAGIVVILFFSYYTFKLSRVTGELVNSEALASGRMSSSWLPSLDRFAGQMEEASEKQSQQQQHLAKLDSLVSEQSRSIQELRKLNTVAVRTFFQIRKHLDLADSVVRTASLDK